VGISSAVLGWLAALLQVLQYTNVTGVMPLPGTDSDENGGVNPVYWTHDYLENYWAYQRTQIPVNIFICLFTSLALLGLTYCILFLKRVFRQYRRGVSDLPAFMLGCFLVGSIIPSVSLLQILGSSTTAALLSGVNGFPDDALQSLTIAYIVSQGTLLFQFSALFLFVSLGIILASVLSLRTGELPIKFAYTGIATAILGFVSFILELATSQVEGNSPIAVAFGVFLILFAVIMLPIWTFWLAMLLPRLKLEEQINAGTELSLSRKEEQNDQNDQTESTNSANLNA